MRSRVERQLREVAIEGRWGDARLEDHEDLDVYWNMQVDRRE
jgi:hypothetical protein